MTKKQITHWFSVIVIGIALGLGLQFVRAWTEPAAAPPGGNVGAPINTSTNDQTKGDTFSGTIKAKDFCLNSDPTKCLSTAGSGTSDIGTCYEYADGNPAPPFFHHQSCEAFYAVNPPVPGSPGEGNLVPPAYCSGSPADNCQCLQGTRALQGWYFEGGHYVLHWACHI